MSEAVIDAVYSAAVPGICSWASCRCEGGSRAIRDSEVTCDENNEVCRRKMRCGGTVIGISYLGMGVGEVVVGATLGTELE